MMFTLFRLLQNEPVDVVSEADESMNGNTASSPTSEMADDGGIFAEDSQYLIIHCVFCIYVDHLLFLSRICCIISVSLNGYASDHCFGNLEMVIIFAFDRLKSIVNTEEEIEQSLSYLPRGLNGILFRSEGLTFLYYLVIKSPLCKH